MRNLNIINTRIKTNGTKIHYVNMDKQLAKYNIVNDGIYGYVDANRNIVIDRAIMKDTHHLTRVLGHEFRHVLDTESGLIKEGDFSNENISIGESRAMASEKEWMNIEEYKEFRKKCINNKHVYKLYAVSVSEYTKMFHEAEIEFYGEAIL